MIWLLEGCACRANSSIKFLSVIPVSVTFNPDIGSDVGREPIRGPASRLSMDETSAYIPPDSPNTNEEFWRETAKLF